MIPSVLAGQIQSGLKDYIDTTFPITNLVFKDSRRNIFPGGSIERTIEYVAPFDRCDREKDYEEVWANFEKRFVG